MTPRIHLGNAQIPGGDELRLYQRGDEFIVALGGNQLMSTRVSASEIALAEMTVERLGDDGAHLLIGGYGMGFTLRSALTKLGAKAKITVAELVPEIIEWARGPMAAVTGGCLDDPRVALHIGDVGAAIADVSETYDAILLDVDNGPDGLSREGNDGLYSSAGLSAARRALRPGGILAIWSSASDAKFSKRLKNAALIVDEVAVRARANGKGARHIIWFAQKA